MKWPGFVICSCNLTKGPILSKVLSTMCRTRKKRNHGNNNDRKEGTKKKKADKLHYPIKIISSGRTEDSVFFFKRKECVMQPSPYPPPPPSLPKLSNFIIGCKLRTHLHTYGHWSTFLCNDLKCEHSNERTSKLNEQPTESFQSKAFALTNNTWLYIRLFYMMASRPAGGRWPARPSKTSNQIFWLLCMCVCFVVAAVKKSECKMCRTDGRVVHNIPYRFFLSCVGPFEFDPPPYHEGEK